MRTANKKIQVAIADDHTLLRKALARLVASFEEYVVLFEAEDGRAVKKNILSHLIPDILLLDVNMPGMDGYDTVKWLYESHPQIKVLALSMYSDEKTIIRMLRLGAKGYILKNIEPEELRLALDSVMKKDFYLSEYISGKVISGLHTGAGDPETEKLVFSEKEKEFLKLICSDLSYKDIAAKMFLSIRSVEDHRNALFEKVKVKTRVSLAMYAIKYGLLDI
jgi:two-component system, NarL family, invasion response regulator UvrY